MNPGQSPFRRDIVVIGGSAGVFEALTFIADLPHSFPAAVFLVVHLGPGSPGLLPDIIGRDSKIPIENAYDGEPISAGRIYVALPDHHLVLRGGIVEVSRGPKENHFRPAIDVLFRSAAKVYGPRVIGVILSGALDDGSAGLVAVRAQGGLGIVQDPEDALIPYMPANALAYAGADHCVPHAELGSLLAQAVMENIDERTVEPLQRERREDFTSEVSLHGKDHSDSPGVPTGFSCPDCGGVLRRIENTKMLRFKCRVGHAFSGETLLAAQSEKVKEALWSALRLLEEKAEMACKLKEYAEEKIVLAFNQSQCASVDRR